ncbi:unnamed protein product [Caenorhabditis auriculariae]|uniref:RUN domain-containing protein n=1 Tax=Caenorhabditis auriculariae TaxID=2777116 RepID=A0A8S1HGL0_9PELO|nr:unnamed protein product [Caenorhabditis auriculariae]
MFRHESADTWRRRPLERRTTDARRGSVVDWINGLTDNNPKPQGSAATNAWTTRSEDERETRNGSVAAVEDVAPDETTQHKDQLICNLKREVKVIMEEAVTRRNLDLNSPYVTSLCAAVDACLMDGLRRRLLGLFGCRSSLALLHSLAKQNATAENVLSKTLTNNQKHGLAPHLVWIREALHMRALSTIIHHINTAKK